MSESTYWDRTDSFEEKIKLLESAWKRQDFRLARALAHSLRNTAIQAQSEEEAPGNRWREILARSGRFAAGILARMGARMEDFQTSHSTTPSGSSGRPSPWSYSSAFQPTTRHLSQERFASLRSPADNCVRSPVRYSEK